MIEILVAINMWCAPVEIEPEEFFYCRQTLLSCVKPDVKKNNKLTQESIKCFEAMERELKKNQELIQSSHAEA